MTLLDNHKAYPKVEVNRATGECYALRAHNRGPLLNFATDYVITSPSKGFILRVHIDDRMNSVWMAY